MIAYNRIHFTMEIDFQEDDFNNNFSKLLTTLEKQFQQTDDEKEEDVLFQYRNKKDQFSEGLYVSKYAGLLAIATFEFVSNKESFPQNEINKFFTFVQKSSEFIALEEYRIRLFAEVSCKNSNEFKCSGELFNLTHKYFGGTYDTGLLFRWKSSDELPGTVTVNILPVADNKRSSFVMVFRIEEDTIKKIGTDKTFEKGLSFVQTCLEKGQTLIQDALLKR